MREVSLPMVRVADLKAGDLCDLEGDAYAGHDVAYEFELQTVVNVDPGALGVEVEFENVSVRFPKEHALLTSRKATP